MRAMWKRLQAGLNKWHVKVMVLSGLLFAVTCEMLESVSQSPWRYHNDETLIKVPHTLHQQLLSHGGFTEIENVSFFSSVGKDERKCLIKRGSQRTVRGEKNLLVLCLKDICNFLPSESLFTWACCVSSNWLCSRTLSVIVIDFP